MNNLIRKKVILCLLDPDPKSVDEIANEIGESLETVENQLTGFVSENICDQVNQDEINPYVVRTDIETFAQLVKEFLSNPDEHRQETEDFITSEYYLIRIDDQLVDYVLNRFHLGSVYQTDEDKEGLRRILLASPTALIFALHGDTTRFRELWLSRNQLDSSDATRDWFIQTLHSQFQAPLSEMLIADINVPAYCQLHAKLQIRVATLRIQVGLATLGGRYIEAMAQSHFTLGRATEELRAGQLVSLVNPMSFSDDGLAFLHLGEFQTALEDFDKALNTVQVPIEKAIVWNNKGLAFFKFGQHQKAIECFEEGIALDSGDEIPQLHENKQLAEEYLARATDADNLTEPTQIRFVQGQSVPFEETLFYEFKEIKSRNPASRIEEIVDEYVVAFLNRQGGRIFWGIRDSNRITVGVKLEEQMRDNIRTKVSNKLGAIRPPISSEHWQLEFHRVYDLQAEPVEDLWVIELVVAPQQRRDVFYTGSGDLFVKTDGGKRKLLGPEVTEFIRRYLQNETETN